jgi:hypothetical protein
MRVSIDQAWQNQLSSDIRDFRCTAREDIALNCADTPVSDADIHDAVQTGCGANYLPSA